MTVEITGDALVVPLKLTMAELEILECTPAVLFRTVLLTMVETEFIERAVVVFVTTEASVEVVVNA